MKIHLLLAGLLVMAVSCGSQKPENTNEMNPEHLIYFSYNHHNSMAMYNGESYSVRIMKDGRVHVVIDEGFPGEKEFYLNDSTILVELQSIVKLFKMDKYKDNYKSPMMIHDGDSWSLYYKYDSKRSVSSGGYMAWPDNYGEMRQALSKYFEKWRNYQEGVLSIDYFQFTGKNNKGCDFEYALERGEKEATLTVRNAEKGINKKLKVSNDLMKELQEMSNMAQMKSELYDYHASDPDATRCDYFVRYNTGDTLKGYTCYTQYPGPKERAVFGFFSQWLEEKE